MAGAVSQSGCPRVHRPWSLRARGGIRSPPLPQATDRLHSQPVVAAEQGRDLACTDLGGQLLIVYVHDKVFPGCSVPGFAHPAAEAVIALLDVSLTVVVRL